MAANLTGISNSRGSEPKELSGASEPPDSAKNLFFSRSKISTPQDGSKLENAKEKTGGKAGLNQANTEGTKGGSVRKLSTNPTISHPAKLTPYSWNMVEQINLTWACIQQGTVVWFSSMKIQSPASELRAGSVNSDKDTPVTATPHTGSANSGSPITSSPHIGSQNPRLASPTDMSPYPSRLVSPSTRLASGKEEQQNTENKHDTLQLPTNVIPGMVPLNLSHLGSPPLGGEPIYTLTSVRSRATNTTNRDKEDQNRESFYREFMKNFKEQEELNAKGNTAHCLLAWHFQNQVEYLDLFFECIFYYSGACLNSEYDKEIFGQRVAKMNNCLTTVRMDTTLFLSLKECLIKTLQQFLGESFQKTSLQKPQSFLQSFEEAWLILLTRIEVPMMVATLNHNAGHTPGLGSRSLDKKRFSEVKAGAEKPANSGTGQGNSGTDYLATGHQGTPGSHQATLGNQQGTVGNADTSTVQPMGKANNGSGGAAPEAKGSGDKASVVKKRVRCVML